MAIDYIPGPDEAFDTWQNTFQAYASANFASLGLVAADFTALNAAQADWQTTLPNHVGAVAAAAAARQAKDDARAAYEAAIRPLVRRLQASPAVDDAERQSLGITVRDAVATTAAAPTSRPVGVVDTSQRLRHTIRFADEGTPTKKARPAGVVAVEIYHAVLAAGAAAPTSASQLTYLASDTSTPYVVEYDGADAGKTAHYWMRWVNNAGKGPWSENVAATVGA